MHKRFRCRRLAGLWLVSVALTCTGLSDAGAGQAAAAGADAAPRASTRLDLGRPRIGKASFYARKFAGRKMADGTRMDPHSDSAASKTLPLGTTARVTNLETGRSTVVTIRDRGPYVKGRIVDLSPAAARKLGIDREDGVARVEVAPIQLPPRDGAAARH
jgi:rare lipoprotein A